MARAGAVAVAAQDEVQDEREAAPSPTTTSGALGRAGAAAVQRMIVATDVSALRLRSVPAIGDNIVGHIARHEEVAMLGPCEHGFAQVRDAHARVGWAAADYLCPAVPVAVASPPEPEMSFVTAVQRDADPRDDHWSQTFRGEPFIKGKGDESDIDPNDVMQGELGDCYFEAAVAAVARANPELIRRLIRRIDEHTYEVTLYTRAHFWSGRSPRKVIINSTFPVKRANTPLYAQQGDDGPHGVELWPMLLEKAYATIEGSYQAIEGGSGGKAFDLLLAGGGRNFDTSDFTPDELAENIDAALRAHQPVTAGTDASRGGAELLIENPHEYSVIRVDSDERLVWVQNPQNKETRGLSYEQFHAAFTTFSLGKR